MLNHNNNQKLFVKFNKDNNSLGSYQFIQNNNFININYYPQGNESKFFLLFLIIIFIYRYNSGNK